MPTRQFSIGHKFLLLCLLFLVLLQLLLMGDVRLFLRPLVLSMEKQFADSQQHRVTLVLQRDLHDLRRISQDWSSWDSLYEYVGAPNPAFASENLIPETMEGLELDLFLLYDKEGRQISSLTSRNAAGQPRLLTQLIPPDLQQLPLFRALFASLAGEKLDSFEGIVPTPAGLMAISLQPVLHSDKQGPVNGALLMGRLLTPDYLERLAQIAGVLFSLSQVSDRQDFSRYRIEDHRVTHVSEPWQEPGMPTLLLTVQVSSELGLLVGETLEYAWFFTAVALGGLTLVFIYLIHRLVLKPLRQLEQYVGLVWRNDLQVIPAPPQRNDEIGRLSNSFVGLLDELTIKQQILARYSYEDSLTGIANRRRFEESFTQSFLRAKQAGSSLALLMIDVDYFKPFNDHYGHPEGDKVLQQVAMAIARSVNKVSDLVARYGGEEFVVLLENSDLAVARQVAERICHNVAQLNIPHASSRCANRVTISCGYTAGIPQGKDNGRRWHMVADESLYQAKGAGRNCARGKPLPPLPPPGEIDDSLPKA
ncbi:diguanylate cyclase [Pseudaeromonas sp. ZJS20]|uniref:GGDEF domain-containing protein n=1 Tax=Pseudaeromonas aegiceratis TaxID=3153928 RepID=UPI00390C5CA2